MREDLIERLRREADISARPGQMDRLNALADEFAAALEAALVDAERYRWLRNTLTNSVGGGVEVNDDALVYQKSEPGEEVRVYWYPDTPVGFYEVHGSTIDAAIDAAMSKEGK